MPLPGQATDLRTFHSICQMQVGNASKDVGAIRGFSRSRTRHYPARAQLVPIYFRTSNLSQILLFTVQCSPSYHYPPRLGHSSATSLHSVLFIS